MVLFFYVFRDFLKNVLTTLAMCLFLFVLFDFIHKSTKYLSLYKPETEDLVLFYLYQSPTFIVQILPIATLLASVITMVLLSRTNEVTAMRAAGMGPMRIGMPVAIGGLVLSLCSAFIGEVVVPTTAKRMHYVEEVHIKKKSQQKMYDGSKWFRDDKTFYHFGQYDVVTQSIRDITIIEMGNGFRPEKKRYIRSATFQPSTKNWQFKDIITYYFWANGSIAYSESLPTQQAVLPVNPKKFQKDERQTHELSIGELAAFIERGESAGLDVSYFQVDYHVKLAFYFASFVVSLIGLRFGYRSERSLETAGGVLLAIAIGVLYWFILNSGSALGKRGTLPPFLAAWMANFIIMAFSAISIWRLRKS